MKKIIIILLAMLPALATMAWTGNGSIANPYQITNVTDLQQLATNVNAGTNYANNCFILTSNLTLTSAWTPIGVNEANSFQGKFDGKGHAISGLAINSTADNIGLFGYTNNATITGLGIVVGSLTGGNNVGGIVGYAKNTGINNSFVSGAVHGTDAVGGIVGFSDEPSISNCYNTAAITGNNKVGGIAGSTKTDSYTLTTLQECTNFSPTDSVRYLTLSGPGITDEALATLAAKTFKVFGNIIVENTTLATNVGLLTANSNIVFNCGFVMRNNTLLNNPDAFTAFTRIKGDFVIEGCPAFQLWQNNGTTNIQRIDGTLKIAGSMQIWGEFLRGLKYVGGDFILNDLNADFWELYATKVTYIGGNLIATNDVNLWTLNFLTDLTFLGGNVTVKSLVTSGSEITHYGTLKALKDSGVIQPTAIITITRADGSIVDLNNLL